MTDRKTEDIPEAEAEIPVDVSGVDPELDFMQTEQALYDAEHHQPERRLSETFVEFFEKMGEGARRLSEHQTEGWREEENDK